MVIRNDIQKLSWPELVGREGTYAVQYIKETTGEYIYDDLYEKIICILFII